MSCFDIQCKDCPEHAVVDGKIVCNKDNRLKLKGVKISEFFGKQE